MNQNTVLCRGSFIIMCLMFFVTAGIFFPSNSFSANKKVVLYSSNKQSSIDLTVNMFKKKYPDIEVSVVRAGSGALMKRIAAEKDNPLGDVFWSGGFGTLGAYKDYFAPYVSPEAKALPKEFIEKNHLWTGVNVHPMVVMYNLKLVDKNQLPKKWTDLFDQKWKDKVVIGDPQTSSAAYIQVYGLYKMYGEEGLIKFLKVAKELSDAAAIYRGVSMGEYPLGITMEAAAYDYVAGGAKEIGLAYPEDGSFLSPEGIVIIKGAKNINEARLLYDFYCSKEVQEELLKESFRRPIRTDIEIEKITKLPSMKTINIMAIDQEEASKDFDKVTKLWDKIKKDLRR
jgi:iron(III) transport system substrate-binding protein